MSPPIAGQELADALLQSVETGAFPQSEQVASAPVGSDALPKLRQALDKARDDTRVCFTRPSATNLTLL